MCDVTPPAELRLPTDERAPGAARKFLKGVSCRTHHARVLDEAELLVSELVTNAVVHGAPPITVEVSCDGSAGLAVSVSDLSPDLPEPRDADPYAEGGRGIHLVDLISDRWGVEERDGDGKQVWFRLLG